MGLKLNLKLILNLSRDPIDPKWRPEVRKFAKHGCMIDEGVSYCDNGGVCLISGVHGIACYCVPGFNGKRCKDQNDTAVNKEGFYHQIMIERIKVVKNSPAFIWNKTMEFY
jgi:hypothetical protein